MVCLFVNIIFFGWWFENIYGWIVVVLVKVLLIKFCDVLILFILLNGIILKCELRCFVVKFSKYLNICFIFMCEGIFNGFKRILIGVLLGK